MRPDGRIAIIAERQHSVVSRSDAIAAGLTPTQIDHRVSSGLWARVHRGTYRLRGSALTEEGAIYAAVAAAANGAVASHTTAARLWRSDAVGSGRVNISVLTRAGIALPGVVVHRPRTLRATDITRIGVIPVTKPVRTLIDLATVARRGVVEDVLDHFIRRGSIDPKALADVLDNMTPNGRRGLRMLTALAHERVETPVFGSTRERRLRELLESAGLPPLTRQFEVRRPDGSLAGRPDLSYPFAKLYIEFDSLAFHTGRKAWENGIQRQNALSALGWLPVLVTASHMDTDPSSVIATVRDALTAR